MVDVAVVTQAQTAGSRWMQVSCSGTVCGSSGSAHYFVESYRTCQNQMGWGCRHLHGGRYNHSLRIKKKDKGNRKYIIDKNIWKGQDQHHFRLEVVYEMCENV